MKLGFLKAALTAGVLLGCGQDTPDGNNDSDTAKGPVSGDTADDGPRFEADSVEALYYDGDNPVWVLIAKADDTWLYVENYPSFGGASGPETRTLDETETNYGTCGVCVLLKTGCQPHGDHAHCAATFMPEPGGSVTFDELGFGAGESWAGSLTSMTFVEVTMNSETFETTPVDGGDTVAFDGYDFRVTLEAGE